MLYLLEQLLLYLTHAALIVILQQHHAPDDVYLIRQLGLLNASAVVGNFAVLVPLAQFPLDNPQLFPQEIVPLAGSHLFMDFGRQFTLHFQYFHFPAQNTAQPV